jgi:phenylalanyl-tRNA synthetase beta chain
MNISYNWLKDLIEIEIPPSDLAQRLTNVGLAVEGIHPVGDDFILDFDLTSNRPDCLSHLGIAREISALTGNPLKISKVPVVAEDVPMPAILAFDVVKVEDPDLCHRFTARIIRNVKIGPSPEWLVKRLEAIGERSINNVADITNYVMHELGQPMHSFDLDKLAENRIVVRRARSGETITTLDGVERKLDESMLAICDAEKPVAVAGIMGGSHSGINNETTNVLLEVAYFKRESIRQTSRKLGLSTEASYRFERGVDIENLKRASNRATELICELAGGEAADIIDVYPTPRTEIEVVSDDISSATKRLTGLDIPEADCLRILQSLGIHAAGPGRYIPPSWRYDIALEEDLVEEVARLSGYEKITDELPPAYGAGEYQATETRKKLLRQVLVDQGFDEAISYSFIDTSFDGTIDELPGLVSSENDEPYVTLQASVIEGATRMRPTIIPGLLDAVRVNFNYQRRNLRLFEIGRVFAQSSSDSDAPNEREYFALAVTGGEMVEGRATPVRELDFYDAKGALEAALDAVGADKVSFLAQNLKHLSPGQSAAVTVGGNVVGHLGRLGEELSNRFKFKQPVFVAEVDIQKILSLPSATVAYHPLPKFPGISRDISFVADRGVTFDEIRNAVVEQRIDLCRGVEFVDTYQGKGIGEGQRSITVRIEYRSDDRTLAESEIEPINKNIIESVVQRLGVKQRT